MRALSIFSVGGPAAFALLAGCSSYPAPVQRMAGAEAATRAAEDNGAASLSQGQLHLRLAHEEIAEARGYLRDGENKRADYALIRAKADAEFALGEARAEQTRLEAQRLAQQIADARSNAVAPTTSLTTTTSATTTAPPPPAVPPAPVTTPIPSGGPR